jgi:hypothetical protein
MAAPARAQAMAGPLTYELARMDFLVLCLPFELSCTSVSSKHPNLNMTSGARREETYAAI